MPYSAEHKKMTRSRIVECARVLFNRHGFAEVTIDMVMGEIGLTRGGFYNHFKNKDELFSEAVSSFLMGRGAQWREEVGVTTSKPGLNMTQQMIEGYLSSEHLGDLDGQCPMIAMPTEVARGNTKVRESYQELLQAMVWLFENNLEVKDNEARHRALCLAALCVGGMVLAKTLPDSDLAHEVREAAKQEALTLSSLPTQRP